MVAPWGAQWDSNQPVGMSTVVTPWGVQWDSNQPVGMSTVVTPRGVPCSGCRVPQLVGRFPPPLYKQLQNIPNQTKAAAQNTLPCSVLRPFSVFSASQLLQDLSLIHI